MKKENKTRKRVLARVLADRIDQDALSSITGGCTGETCTVGGDSDRGRIVFDDTIF